MEKKKFYLETYGCQMNEYDSHLVESLLTAAGFEKTESESRADIVILNTCSVRQHAEERALGRIRSVSSARRPREIAVIGCMAQRMGDELLEINKGVKYVLGTDSFYKIAEILKSGNGKQIVDISCGVVENTQSDIDLDVRVVLGEEVLENLLRFIEAFHLA